MKLWLDDIRDPAQHGHIGWHWVKSADDAILALKSGLVRKASLDHDLTLKQMMGEPDGKPTGLTVVYWMLQNDVWPPEGLKVHSVNPIGRQRMEAIIARAYARKVTATFDRQRVTRSPLSFQNDS